MKQNINILLENMKKIDLEEYEDRKALNEQSNNILDVNKNHEEYNPDKKRKVLIVLDDMFADMIRNLMLKARSLVVSSLRPETKGSGLESYCQLCKELSHG